MKDQGKHLQVSGGPTSNAPSPISSASSVPHGSQFKIIVVNSCCGGVTYEVVDSADHSLFKFSEYSAWSSNLILQDDYGRTIATLKQKNFSNHSRWNAYRGEKPHTEGDLLFTMARPKVFQWKQSFNVWLAGKQEPDFALTKSKRDKHFKISHQGQIVAELLLFSRIRVATQRDAFHFRWYSKRKGGGARPYQGYSGSEGNDEFLPMACGSVVWHL